MKRLALVLITAVLSTQAFADSEIRANNGASCEQSDFQPYELGLYADSGNRDYNYDYVPTASSYYDSYDNQEQSVGIEFKYSFGGAKPIDCTRFKSLVEREQDATTRQLEMKVAELEKKLLKQEALSRVKF